VSEALRVAYSASKVDCHSIVCAGSRCLASRHHEAPYNFFFLSIPSIALHLREKKQHADRASCLDSDVKNAIAEPLTHRFATHLAKNRHIAPTGV